MRSQNFDSANQLQIRTMTKFHKNRCSKHIKHPYGIFFYTERIPSLSHFTTMHPTRNQVNTGQYTKHAWQRKGTKRYSPFLQIKVNTFLQRFISN